MRQKFLHKTKAFTIMEVLVTLALTSIAITISYSVFSYTQKLFHDYKDQNRFLNQYMDLKKRMDLEALRSDYIVEQSQNNFSIIIDTSVVSLNINEKSILMKRGLMCDTFKLEAKKISKAYEKMENPAWAGKLLKKLEFETEYRKQKFNFYFYKTYEAGVKLQLERLN